MAFIPEYRAATGRAAGIAAVDTGLRAYMLRVYNWMASGLVLTGIVAYGIAETSLRDLFYHAVTLQNAMGETFSVMRPTALGYLSIFAPLAFVMVLSFGVNRLSRTTAQALFWAFCAVMGASLTSIFFVYEQTSIVRVFFITATMFAGMSLWGYTTRTDLTRFGSFLIMGLFGIVIAFVVNMFLHSQEVQFVASVIGVLVFTGLTAFDTQRIKLTYQNYLYAAGPDEAGKRSVYDALSLYLNFINLFMLLLQLTGTRSNNS